MARSQDTFSKKEREKKKRKKQQGKAEKREQRKSEASEKKSFEDMIMYVDENGNLTPDKPDPSKKKKISAKDIEIGVPKKEEQAEQAVRSGTVKFFDEEKGFGFIIDHASNDNIFVHVSGLMDEIRERDKVTFEIENGPKGPAAVAVRLSR